MRNVSLEVAYLNTMEPINTCFPKSRGSINQIIIGIWFSCIEKLLLSWPHEICDCIWHGYYTKQGPVRSKYVQMVDIAY